MTVQPLTLIQITDSHLLADPEGELLGVNTHYTLRCVLDHLMSRHQPADLLLATGDIAQDGSLEAYRRFLELVEPFDMTVRGLPGNHDTRDNFHRVWGERAHPVLDMGAWRIVMLDSTVAGSDSGHLAQDQLSLLKRAAAQADGRHVLVAVHHNPIAVQSPWLDTMMIANGPELFDILASLPQVRALVWGHVHQEVDQVFRCAPERSEHALRLLATPSTCVQFAPNSETFRLDSLAPGYRWITLHADGAIDSGIERVPGLVLEPDAGRGGY
jgi:Icc protein